MYDILKKVAAVNGVSGCESNVAAVIGDEIKKYADSVTVDNLGNLIACRHGKGNADNKKKIMLCAHMDEIGFMVTFVEDSGMLRVAPVGGIGLATTAYIRVLSEKGVRGVLAPEGKAKPADYTADKFFIDIGATSKRDALRRVAVGDCFRFDNNIVKLSGSRVCGHPLDDRVGCAVVLDIARQLADAEIADDVYYVFSVQEEVGCRGAKTAAYAIAPDIALAFDVTGTGDIPGSVPMACRQSGGAAIKVKDSSVICEPTLVDALIETAKKNKIKYQLEILTYGGTDTSSMQMAGAGSRACALSIPSRYIHSENETVDLADAQACADLATAFIKEIR